MSAYSVTVIRTDVNGTQIIIPNQQVSILYRSDDSIAPIYEDENLTIPADNPATTNSMGVISFFAEGGEYKWSADVDGQLIEQNFDSGVTFSSLADSQTIGKIGRPSTVAEMTSINWPINSSIISTRGYQFSGDGGQGDYINRGQGWPIIADGLIDHTDAAGNFLELQHKGEIHVLQAGATELEKGTLGASSRDALNACLTRAATEGFITSVAATKADGGAFYVDSPITVPDANEGLGINAVILKGSGKTTSEIFTDQNIDVFIHRDRFTVRDLSVVQRATGDGVTGNKWTGVAFRANAQCRFCDFRNIEIWWFKFGHLQRFSLWNNYENIYYVQNRCGVKLARSDDMENVNNPSPAGSWNDGDGWFHNQNTWNNIVFNGGSGSTPNAGNGEVGFWGAVQGNTFDTITFQNYNRDGAQTNTVLPAGEISIPCVITGGGPTSSATFNNSGTNWYFERNKRSLLLEDCRGLTIVDWFDQAQSGGDWMIKCDSSVLTIIDPTGQSPGFTQRLVLTNNSRVVSNFPIVASGASDSIDASSSYEILVSGSEGSFTATLTPETSGTITLSSSADLVAWTKSGRRVTVNGRIDIASVSAPSGNFVTLGTLPFPVSNETERSGNGGGGSATIFGGAVSPSLAPVITLEGMSSLRIYIDASLLTTEQFYFTITYLTD